MKNERRRTSLPPVRQAMAGSWLFLSLVFASPAAADLKAVTVDPAAPASCDSVTIGVSGDIPNDCYEIVGAQIRGPEPIPCMRPTPCPSSFFVEITVREANPAIERPCILVTAPYTRSFAVGRLAAGDYVIQARERIVPFAPDSTDSIVSETFASGSFSVTPDTTCAVFPGCYILGFGRDLVGEGIIVDPRCTASAAPGGTACLDLTLTNSRPVGGLQTTLEVWGSVVTVSPDAFVHAVSVDPMGRAAGFQVGWAAEGSSTKLLLYSPSGASIAAGEGPVARICYSIAPETTPQKFRVVETETVVSDPAGNSMPPCPTFAVIPPGIICVGAPACDVNGDGASDVLDVIRMVRCALAGGSDSTSACPDSIAARSDCNGDGSVDVRDVVCCVRKIVRLTVPGTPVVVKPQAPPLFVRGNAIEFEGSARWINAVDGVAVVRMDMAADWGGAQFSVDPGGSGVRIRDMKLIAADPRDQLEWGIDDAGIAHAIVFTTAGAARTPGSDRIEISLERRTSGSAPGSLRLGDAKAGTTDGSAAFVSTTNESLELPGAAPAAPSLLSARPNPTSGTTEIGLVLPAGAHVTLRVYDVAGRLIRTLIEGPMPAGVHRARWDGLDARGRAARSGIYFAKLEAGSTIRSEQILLLR